jgi:hypothetical protein
VSLELLVFKHESSKCRCFMEVLNSISGLFALALELNIMVNSTSMSWQHVCLPLKSFLVDVDGQAIV